MNNESLFEKLINLTTDSDIKQKFKEPPLDEFSMICLSEEYPKLSKLGTRTSYPFATCLCKEGSEHDTATKYKY